MEKNNSGPHHVGKERECSSSSTDLKTETGLKSYLTCESACKMQEEMKFNLPQFREDCFKLMMQMRNNVILTDIQLQVGRDVIPAHKVVLAAASPYFKAMFTSGLMESETNTVRLQGVTHGIMMYLVGFMYTGQLLVSEQNVCLLLSAASMFQVKQVVSCCCEFLEKQIEAANVIGISSFALQNGCMDLHAKAISFIEQHFSEVSQTEEFLELNGTQLVYLIQKDDLNVPDEEAVFSAVMRWVQYRPCERQEKMHCILKFIRCHHLPPRFISDQISNCSIIKTTPEIKAYLASVFEEVCRHRPPVGEARWPRMMMSLFHVVGGYSLRQSRSELYIYHVEKNKWAELGPLEVARSGLGGVFLRGSLYAVAGRSICSNGTVSDTDALTKYSHSDGAWSACCSLQQRRNRLGVGVLDNLLYAVGGVDGAESLCSAERYDPDTDRWTYIRPMTVPRGGLCCAVLHRLLFAIGGCDDNQERLRSVECYNPDRDVWTREAPLNVCRSGAAAAVVGNKIYVLGGYDGKQQISSVEMYDPEVGHWTFAASMKVARSALGVAATHSKIYAMGGFDGQFLLSTVEVYNVARNEWSDGPALPWLRSGHAVAVPTCLLPPTNLEAGIVMEEGPPCT